MPKATEQYNLHIINPGLSKEWHPIPKRGFKSEECHTGFRKKSVVDMRRWDMNGKRLIYSRNRGSGCPFCNKPTPADNSDILITDTDLVKEWHLSRNSGLNVRNLPPGFK